MKKQVQTSVLAMTMMLCATGMAVAGAQDKDLSRPRKEISDGQFMRLESVCDLKLVTSMVTDGKEEYEKLGTINDLVVNGITGDIESLVVSSGGVLGVADTLRTVSVGEVRFNSKEKRFETKMSEESFKAIAAFDAGDFRERQMSARKRIIDAGAIKRDGGEARDQGEKAKTEALRAESGRIQCLARDLAGWEIHVMEDEAGDSKNVYIDVAGSKVAFIEFEFECGMGEDKDDVTLVVPFSSLEVMPPTKKGVKACSLHLNLTKLALTEAPSIGDNEDVVLEDRTFRDEVRAFYATKTSSVRRK